MAAILDSEAKTLDPEAKTERPTPKVALGAEDIEDTVATPPIQSAKRVLVLVPHGDDEIIGCGGKMLSHLQIC